VAFVFNNNIFLRYGFTPWAVFALKEALKAVGWTVPISSDGITYNASGDQIAHRNSGANGMDNNNAWFVVRAPDNLHEWMFQRGLFPQGPDNNISSQYWYIGVSKTAGFVAGAIPATDKPTAPDSGFVSDDNFYGFNLGGFNRDIRWNICVEDTAPWRFYAAVLDGSNGDYEYAQMIAMDALHPNTLAVSIDPDPYVYICTADHYLFGWGYVGTGTQQRFAMYDGQWLYDDYSSGIVMPGSEYDGQGANPYNGKDDLGPIIYGFTKSMGQGVKGLSSLFKNVLNPRSIGTVLTVDTLGDRIILGPGFGYLVAAPWNGTLPKRDIA